MNRGLFPHDALRRRFQRRLLIWYRRHRRDLPWRRTRDPYRVLVSEIMLQQTQVERVIPKYRQFLRRYPTIGCLARARPSAVRRLWYPLGYNIRPLRLVGIARETVARYGGRLPGEMAALRALPGVGPYTAGALLSFAYDQDAALVDTNVRRVLARIFFGPRRRAVPSRAAAAVPEARAPRGDQSRPSRAAAAVPEARAPRGDQSKSRAERGMWALAEYLLPRGQAYDWNQALMDFGATWCTARAPRCPRCPMRDFCATSEGMGGSGRPPRPPTLGPPRRSRGAPRQRPGPHSTEGMGGSGRHQAPQGSGRHGAAGAALDSAQDAT